MDPDGGGEGEFPRVGVAMEWKRDWTNLWVSLGGGNPKSEEENYVPKKSVR